MNLERSKYEPGDKLRHPISGTVFEIVEWSHAVILRHPTTGVLSAVPSGMADLFERVE